MMPKQYQKFAILLSLLLCICQSQESMHLEYNGSLIPMVQSSTKDKLFYEHTIQMDCGMPELYIYKEYVHESYKISCENMKILKIYGKWSQIEVNLECELQSCIAVVDNNCQQKSQNEVINWIVLETSIGQLEYLVNCNPSVTYKPFQWGLFILILFCSISITLTSLYSKAWSYGGLGFDVTFKFIFIFNLLLVIGVGLIVWVPDLMALILMIGGTVVGAIGVTVCANEVIWLTKSKFMRKKVIKVVRVMDLLSLMIGLALTTLFWITKGQWFLNDILAVCTIIALIKFLKVRSLLIGVVLECSLLLIEGIILILVRYILNISYNNYVINKFQNPLMVVFPSLSHSLYRQCAWLPISSLVFPGLLLSYLRRFDASRGSYLYLLIGFLSYYLGSIVWMLIDLETIHSLPFALVSEPVTIIIVVLVSLRRNQLKPLWKGYFHDNQLPQISQNLIHKQKETEIISISEAAAGIQELTGNLKIQFDHSGSHSIEKGGSKIQDEPK